MLACTVYAELKPYPTTVREGEKCYIYKAEQSIGIYRISVNFGCSQADILRLNPHLKTRGLQLGETLYIPIPATDLEEENIPEQHEDSIEKDRKQTVSLPDTSKTDVVAETIETIETTETIESTSDRLRVALVMPLYAQAAERNLAMEKFYDFYEGVLLATYALQQAGTPVELHVFDVEKSEAKVEELISNHKLDGMNAILGPAYNSQVTPLADYAEQHRIPMLLPFSDRVEQVEVNPYLMQFNAGALEEAEVISGYLAADSLINVVLVDARESDLPETIRQIRLAIQAKEIHISLTTVRDILCDSLSRALLPGYENVLLLNSEKYANINVLMPKIRHTAETSGRQLTLLSRYAWQKEDITIPQIYVTQFATDSTDRADYEATYDRYFHHEHASEDPRYDLLGYDLMQALVARLENRDYQGLQSRFSWRKSEEGGMKNVHLEVIRK